MTNEPLVPNWTDTGLRRNAKFPLLFKKRASISAKIKALEEEKKAISDAMFESLQKHEVEACLVDGSAVRIVTTTRSKVDEGGVKRDLVEKFGVKLQAVRDAWDRNTSQSTSSHLYVGAPPKGVE